MAERGVPRKGRGATASPDARYLDTTREAFDDGWGTEDDPLPPLKTAVKDEQARSIIAHNDSPDIPFSASINPYRGCEHGCTYCYARPTHAYLDLSPGIDFETRLFAKVNAAEVLRAQLAKPGYRAEMIALGANTDPYQPVERSRGITRQVIEVLHECDHPVGIVTKSALVERDIDLLAPMAAKGLAHVFISITTLDHELARRMEPRATAPRRRVEAVRRLSAAGIPVGVMFAPVIPALNDSEMESVLEQAVDAGARYAGYVMIRLPLEISDMFRDWLQAHYPLKAAHVMSIIRELRGGRDYRADFATRQVGTGHFAALIGRRFKLACERLGLNRDDPKPTSSLFRPPAQKTDQLSLF